MANLGLLQYRPASELRAEEEQQAQQLADDQARRREVFESSLGAHIRRCWEEAKMAKQETEYRLLNCLRRRKGEYDPSKLQAIKQEGGSAIYMMLTATKCRAASSWIRDILMPANERPWGLDPTPIAQVPPEFLQPVFSQFMEQAALEAQQTGQMPQPQAVMKAAEDHIRHAVQERAEEAAERHEELIADQLAEGGWDDALADYIDDFTTFPNAFIRGHNLRRVASLSWMEGWKAVKSMEIKPDWYRVSPFDMYPSPDATSIDNGAYIIERCRFTRGHLNKLIGVPGYNEDAIRKVLEEHGQSGLRHWLWSDGERAELEGRGHEWLTRGQTIDALIYCGGAQGVSLLQWGINPDDIEDPLAEYEVEAIQIGNHVIRVKINRDPLERRPYHTASFQPVPGSFWGQGIPELMADVQDVCNATARSLVNNLAISSGPQVEVYMERLDPTEDPENIYPWKVWKTKDSQISGNNRAVEFYQPTSNASELLAVYEKFEIRADDATNIPRYSYGNERVGGAGSTASGLSMLMESANKGIKDAIRHIDRGVIRRVIEALWLHNMQYSDDNSIKGDVAVVPRGSSAMLIREQTHQMRTQFLQMTANPIDMAIIGNEGRRDLLEKVAEKLDMPGLIPSEDKMLENAKGQGETAQLMQQLDAAIKKAELREKDADAAKSEAEAAETQAETQETMTMTPLKARKLMAEIINMVNQHANDERKGLEGPGEAGSQPGRSAPAGNPQGQPGGMPGQPGAGGYSRQRM